MFSKFGQCIKSCFNEKTSYGVTTGADRRPSVEGAPSKDDETPDSVLITFKARHASIDLPYYSDRTCFCSDVPKREGYQQDGISYLASGTPSKAGEIPDDVLRTCWARHRSLDLPRHPSRVHFSKNISSTGNHQIDRSLHPTSGSPLSSSKAKSSDTKISFGVVVESTDTEIAEHDDPDLPLKSQKDTEKTTNSEGIDESFDTMAAEYAALRAQRDTDETVPSGGISESADTKAAELDDPHSTLQSERDTDETVCSGGISESADTKAVEFDDPHPLQNQRDIDETVQSAGISESADTKAVESDDPHSLQSQRETDKTVQPGGISESYDTKAVECDDPHSVQSQRETDETVHSGGISESTDTKSAELDDPHSLQSQRDTDETVQPGGISESADTKAVEFDDPHSTLQIQKVPDETMHSGGIAESTQMKAAQEDNPDSALRSQKGKGETMQYSVMADTYKEETIGSKFEAVHTGKSVLKIGARKRDTHAVDSTSTKYHL